MSDKYIVTVETNQGNEVICYLKPKKTTGTLEEVREWVKDSQLNFAWCKYHIYQLSEVKDEQEG